MEPAINKGAASSVRMNSQAANQKMAAAAGGTWFALLVLSSFLSGMACLPPSDQSDGRTGERERDRRQRQSQQPATGIVAPSVTQSSCQSKRRRRRRRRAERPIELIHSAPHPSIHPTLAVGEFVREWDIMGPPTNNDTKLRRAHRQQRSEACS